MSIAGNMQSRCCITCHGKTDGPGAQAQAVMSTMLYARESGMDYVHTPFSSLSHNDRNEADWEKRWEEFFNLGQGEPLLSDVISPVMDILRVDNPDDLALRGNTLYVVQHCHAYADQYPDGYLKLAGTLIEKYRGSDKTGLRLYQDPECLNISVHMRRGDVSKDANWFRFTGNDFMAALLGNIVSTLDKAKIRHAIHLYSQGSPDDFGKLAAMNICFHLDECEFSTFHNLVSSDMLVMSKSSFSYSAALLAGGVVMYEPFWHSPLSSWVIADRRGEFDARSFMEKVMNRLDSGNMAGAGGRTTC